MSDQRPSDGRTPWALATRKGLRKAIRRMLKALSLRRRAVEFR